jgi:hypothetical protein
MEWPFSSDFKQGSLLGAHIMRTGQLAKQAAGYCASIFRGSTSNPIRKNRNGN